MFVVDLLHEFELGVWKKVFTHLMRILCAVGGTALQELNYRYATRYYQKQVPANQQIDIAESQCLDEEQFGASARMPLP